MLFIRYTALLCGGAGVGWDAGLVLVLVVVVAWRRGPEGGVEG